MDGSLKDLVKVRRHLINLLLMVFFWISSSFGIYLVNIGMKNNSGDFFWNNLIVSLCDLPIALLGGWLYHRFGLKVVMFAFFTVSLLGAISVIIFS
jgi:Na+/melibiose symporter-like transporter